MKNYLTNYNRSNSPFDFIDSAFDDLFRPLFYDEKLDAMKTDIRETKDAYILVSFPFRLTPYRSSFTFSPLSVSDSEPTVNV